jgi:DNA repair photolyase
MTELVQIERMNGKPVYYVPAKSVVNFDSGFGHKLLCDFLTFSAGSACAYECSYCYVTDLMRKSPHLQNVRDQHTEQFPDQSVPSHSEIVIRRRGVLDALRHQLTLRGKPRFTEDPSDQRVIYMSPLVDVAANPTLCEETVEACRLILELTHWQIRLLSKSSFLPRIAKSLGRANGARKRVIYGVSTGTLDDNLARCFEEGTALVSKRLESLHWLQNNGYRTFGMICPSLPSDNYEKFSNDICEAIRVDRCEHVWAEVMNLRGESFTRTISALRSAGYEREAHLLELVTDNQIRWEAYARNTFESHTKSIPAKKLRFLQYVTASTRSWWEQQQPRGSVLL